MSVTKNKLSFETICRMAKKAFPEKNVETAEELTEGLCNTAYRINFTDGSQSILKVASGSTEGYLSNEINMMETEVKAMHIMRDSGAVKVAEVQYYDKSKTICSGTYFLWKLWRDKATYPCAADLQRKRRHSLILKVVRWNAVLLP